MDRMIYLNTLYDIYKGLFTEKQKMYYESYYFENLSLAEIADNNSVSRNAVHNQLKIIEDRLIELENILKLNEKQEKIMDVLSKKADKKLLEEIKRIM